MYVCDGYLSPLTYWADSGRWSSDAGGGDTVLHGAGMAQLGGGSSSRDLWGSWGGVGWLALGCLRLGRQVQWLCTLTVLQKPKQHSFACCDHRRNLEAGVRGETPPPSSPRPLAIEALTLTTREPMHSNLRQAWWDRWQGACHCPYPNSSS